MADYITSNRGYAEEAKQLLVRYESVSFEVAHSAVLNLLPEPPSDILDIGSGTGRDAAYLAGLGHRVVAVEPTDEFRIPASHLHPSPLIEWIDDGLPELRKVTGRGELFDLIMLTAVWMHLDAAERRSAMPVLGSMIRPGGLIIMSLRHGPVPAGRRMFEVSGEETIALAAAERLTPVCNLHTESSQDLNRRAGVTWTRLVLKKGVR